MLPFFAFVISGCSRGNPVKEARKLIEKGEYKKAIEYLRETSKETSPLEQDELNILLGIAYIRIRKYGQAKDILFSTNPENSRLKEFIARALIELGDSAKKIGYRKMAKEAYEIALLRNPNIELGNRYLLLIRESYKIGDCDMVIRFSARYISETHDTSRVFTKYVDCLYQEGKWRTIDSLKEYFIQHNRIRDMGWSLGEAMYNIAVQQISMGKIEKAKEILEELVNKVKSPRVLLDEAYFLLGGIFEELQEPDSALDMYYKCMKTSLTTRSPLYKESVARIRELKNEMGLN